MSLLLKLKYFGFRRYCPACGSRTRRFLNYGSPPRSDARCPVCGSSERERSQVLLLRRNILPKLGKRSGLRVLHIAPEAGIARTLRALPGVEYLSGDITPGRAMEVVDLTRMRFDDASLDFVFLSHVLEHIEDDRLAMREIHRVLAPGAAAFVEVPVLASRTYEDAALQSEEERLKAFGQVDHVRICGLDYAERLTQAGFSVEELAIERHFPAEDVERMRLRAELTAAKDALPPRFERVFPIAWLCTKPRSA